MKKIFRVSLLANALLCGVVVWLVRERRAIAPQIPSSPQAEIQSQPAAAIAPSESSTASTPPPFRWSDLESSDYHTYLANLRNIGCPEQTIRDIITADVDSVFAQRREQAQRTPGNTQELQL